jgi:hypothetical protein
MMSEALLRVLPIPAGTLRSGPNALEINGDRSGVSDDIEVSDIAIGRVPVSRLLTQATIPVEATAENGPLPVKFTVVDAEGFLVPLAGGVIRG